MKSPSNITFIDCLTNGVCCSRYHKIFSYENDQLKGLCMCNGNSVRSLDRCYIRPMLHLLTCITVHSIYNYNYCNS